jgi:hypothetical protein
LKVSDIWSFLSFAVVPLLAWFAFRQARHMERNWLRPTARLAAGFVGLVSTLVLVGSLPRGSIDISDLWRYLFLGLLPFVALLILVLARYIKPHWIRVSIRTVASLVAIPAGLVLLLLCLAQSACVYHSSPIYSPDGNHVALVTVYGQGALGVDYASVSVRRAWIPIATEVYDGIGAWPGSFSVSPEVRWLDASHLLIRYSDPRHDEAGGPHLCEDNFGSVQIVCENTAVARPR